MSAGGGFAARNAAIALAVLVLAAVAGVVWWRGRDATPSDEPRADGRTIDGSTAPSAAGTDVADVADVDVVPDPRLARAERTREVWRERLGEPPGFPDPLHGAAACERVEAELERVCAAIDAGVALEGRALQRGSCAFIREAATRLAGRPPALPEGRDPHAWIGNAFHVFRALGEERIAAAAALVDAEPELVEPLALAAYRWAATRESCRGDGSPTPITPARLYDYGALAFTSFGGQAYLRRRAPRLEALGCFYALAALELSIEQGHNPHGVDPRGEIERCRSLVDGAGLGWSAGYGRELERIAAAWRRRTGG